MRHISYSAFRADLANQLDKVNEDHAPVLVTRQNGAPAVVMSLEDFSAWQETVYLRSSPRNAERLDAAIQRLNAGQGETRDLIDE